MADLDHEADVGLQSGPGDEVAKFSGGELGMEVEVGGRAVGDIETLIAIFSGWDLPNTATLVKTLIQQLYG